MKISSRTIWTLYFILLIGFVIRKVINFYVQGHEVNTYFTILYAFDPLFLVNYIIALFQIILNVIHLIPTWLYIIRKPVFNAKVWQYLFILKIIFDIYGHSYEIQYLRSLYFYHIGVLIYVFAQSVSVYIPSYIACYRYAFHRDKFC